MQQSRDNWFDKGLDALAAICRLLTGVGLVTLTLMFGWLVFGRYVLNDTPTWVEQLALVLICYIAFLGAAAGVRDGTHLGVSFIREALPRPLRRALDAGPPAQAQLLAGARDDRRVGGGVARRVRGNEEAHLQALARLRLREEAPVVHREAAHGVEREREREGEAAE